MDVRLSVVVAMVLAAQPSASALELVRSGKPVATIVVAADASEGERFAASELRAFIEKMSGASLPIKTDLPKDAEGTVLVGAGAVRAAGEKVAAAAHFDELGDDGYAIVRLQQSPPCLLLLGKRPRGTLYAVYDLLETTLDCGFFTDGDNVPRRPDIVIPPLNSVANPVFATRACWVPQRVYAPKRFQATLWNAADWQAFLRWMAKKKLNCLAVAFTADTRAWGEAFDRAFPEAASLKQETLPANGAPAGAGHTARMGWGLSPEHRTSLLNEVFAYARRSLDLEVTYVLSMGEFERPLREAHPGLKWQPAAPAAFPGVAGGTSILSTSDPKCRELQRRLWTALVETYGTDHRYVVSSGPPPGLAPAPGECATALGLELLREVDPEARAMAPTWDADGWGKTPADKAAYLRHLPAEATLLYHHTSFADLRLYESTERLVDRPFALACLWGGGPGNDLFENRFGCIRNQFRHLQANPKSKANGFCNWNEVRGVNPMMDDLCAEFAWTGLYIWRGEGASTNHYVRRYLGRRYAPGAVFPMAEAYKEALRGAPRAEPDTNYRAYVRWSDTQVPGLLAARAAVALAIACKAACAASPFYEADLVDLGRNYLHQHIQDACRQVVELVRQAKQAARTQAYSAEARAKALGSLETVEGHLLAAHKALSRLIATRKDMALDEAIQEALSTSGANRDLVRAIREHQSGLLANGITVVDSIEYHQQLKSRQVRFLLDYARRELGAPTPEPLPSWEQFFHHGAREFVEDGQLVPYEQKAEKALPSRILQDFLETAE